MLKRFGVSVIISLLMLLVYNSDMFTLEKKCQIMDTYKDGTVRAVYTPLTGKPQNYRVHSNKKFGEWEAVKELSPMGNTVMFILLMSIIVIVAETFFHPDPYNPYKE